MSSAEYWDEFIASKKLLKCNRSSQTYDENSRDLVTTTTDKRRFHDVKQTVSNPQSHPLPPAALARVKTYKSDKQRTVTPRRHHHHHGSDVASSSSSSRPDSSRRTSHKRSDVITDDHQQHRHRRSKSCSERSHHHRRRRHRHSSGSSGDVTDNVDATTSRTHSSDLFEYYEQQLGSLSERLRPVAPPAAARGDDLTPGREPRAEHLHSRSSSSRALQRDQSVDTTGGGGGRSKKSSSKTASTSPSQQRRDVSGGKDSEYSKTSAKRRSRKHRRPRHAATAVYSVLEAMYNDEDFDPSSGGDVSTATTSTTTTTVAGACDDADTDDVSSKLSTSTDDVVIAARGTSTCVCRECLLMPGLLCG